MINLEGKRILVTGGAGFLGSRIVKLLKMKSADVFAPRRSAYDLRYETDIKEALLYCNPEIVIHCAAHAGGIGLNQAKPAELFYDNAIMGIQLMHKSMEYGVEKFVQIGTVCEYPKFTQAPFHEDDLWRGYPEDTNAPYGVAKRALLVQGQAYRQQYGFNVIHLLPVNLYGPGDNFDTASSHVIPALIRRLVEAKQSNNPEVIIWGTGKASREFLYVEDAAKAIVKATEYYDEKDPVNIGSGQEIDVRTLVRTIADLVGYTGGIDFDSSKPDGQPRRWLNTRRAFEKFGFVSEIDLMTGLKKTIDSYLNQETKRTNA